MRSLLWRLDPFARRFGFYTSYQLARTEYIGTTHRDDCRAHLRAHDYEHAPRLLGIPLQAIKTHPESKTPHTWALRRVDPDNARYQYHVHAWANSGKTELFSHYEYRPDLRCVVDETHSMRVDRLRTHYRPTVGQDYVRGKADSSLLRLIKD